MKIETWLQPNCSESTILIVDWNKRNVIENYEAVSDGTDNDEEMERIKGFVDYLKQGIDVQITSNGTDMHNTELSIAKAIVNNKMEYIDWDSLIKDFMEGTGDGISVNISKYEDKLKNFAEGRYKKNATGKKPSR